MAPVANAYASEACGTDPKAAATAAARGWVLAIPVSWHFILPLWTESPLYSPA